MKRFNIFLEVFASQWLKHLNITSIFFTIAAKPIFQKYRLTGW